MRGALRYFLLFLIVLILLPFQASGKNAALFIPRNDAFWQTFVSYTQTASESIGLNLKVYNSKENPKTMLNQVDRVCQQGIDAVIFMNYQGIGESILKIADKYKTPAFLVNTTFEVRTFTPRGKYRYWIGELTADDRHAGNLLARRLAEIAGKKGIKELNIFAFQGRKKDIASIMRMEGLRTFIDAANKAKLVATEPADWDREHAKAIFLSVLIEHPQINMIWGANDRMALGAAEAAKELGIEKPMVYGGINWGLDALKALDRGFIDIDVGGHIFDGALAAIMVFDYLNGYDFANERLRFTGNMVAITRNNIDKFNAIFVSPGLIDFKSLSKTHTLNLLQYNFDLNSIVDKAEPIKAALTSEELAWIQQHPVIRVGNETDWPPFDFAEDGKAMGYSIDFLRLAGKKMNLSFEFVNGYSWDELMTMLRKEEIHVLPVVARTPKRLEFMEFTSSYMHASTVVVTRGNEKSIKRISDLKGKRLAVIKGYHYEESVIRDYPKVMIIPVKGFLEGLEAVLHGRAEAFVGNESVINYTVRHYFLSGLKVVGRTGIDDIDMFKFHMGVPKQQKILASILDKGIQAISNDEKQALFDRWIGFVPLSIEASKTLQFTEDEQAFLDSHPVIHMGIMDAWPPFDFIDENGIPKGIGVSYIEALNRRLNGALKIVPGTWKEIYNRVKERKLDGLMDITPKPAREEFFNFTKPYLSVPHVIVAPRDTPFLQNEEDLQGKTLALERGFGNVNYFREKYPNVNIKEYRDTAYALGAVARGEADAYAGNRTVALYLITKEVITNLKVHGRLKKDGSILAMGTRKDRPILRDILQKALDDISQEEKRAVVGRWVALEQEKTGPPMVILSPDEKAFLSDHPVIRVASEPDYVPFDFRIDENPVGYSIDFVKLLAERLGIRIEYIKDTWGNLLKKAEKKEVDLVHSIFKKPKARERYLNFTRPYKKVVTAIVVRDEVESINSLQDLGEYKVALVRGDSHVTVLKSTVPIANQILFNDFTEALKAVAFGKADAAVTELPVAGYLIRSLSLTNLKVVAEVKDSDDPDTDYRLAVRKDWSILIPILEKAMDTLSSEELKSLEDKWMSLPSRAKKTITLQLTEVERQWLDDHPVIRVSNEKAWPPFDYMQNNREAGVSIDYIKLLAERIGVNLEFVHGNWEELLGKFKEKQIDLIHPLMMTEDRKSFTQFSSPHIQLNNVLIVKNTDTKTRTLGDLNGKTLAVCKGWANHEFIKNSYPRIKLLIVEDTYEGLMAVSKSMADAYADSLTVAEYFIKQHLLANLKILFDSKDPELGHMQLHLGTRKDWPVFHGILNKAIESVTSKDIEEIYAKWGLTFSRIKPGLQFTLKESAFIKAHPILRLGYDIDWYPVEFIDDQGQFKGIAADYINRIEKLLGMKIKPLPPKSWQEMMDTAENGELEIMSAIVKTPKRQQYLDFTAPYLNFPMVIITREETPYISDMNGLRGKQIAVVSSYITHEILRDRHPELDLMPFSDTREGLMAVNQRRAFAFVGNMATVSHILGREGLSRLKISGETPYSYHLSMATRKNQPVLAGLVQKALDAIPQEERSAISRKWFSITYKHEIDYSLVWKILVSAFLLFSLLFFWNRKLSRLNHQLALARNAEHQALLAAESSNQQLLKANDRLKELDLLKSMFIASMSHELRTPLNSIIGFSGLMLQGLSGILSEEQKDNLQRIHKAGNHLLALISDVIDISKIEAGRIDVFQEKFALEDLVGEAVETIRPQADAKGLTLSVAADTWPVMHTDYKRLLQCLLNLIGNAVKYSEKGKITLSVSENMTDVEIRVQDTGIGIAQEDLPKLFNAFERLESRLRVKAGGTGLGLYLTKKIATELLQGSVRAESTPNVGSVFYLKIPTDLNMEGNK